jgi:HEAT repeat protein
MSKEGVPWETLGHAYGPAGDVPDLLRALSSDGRAAQEEALYELFGTIWHQGTVYSVTAAAVPPLLELLETPAVAVKDGILALLKEIATGHGYVEVHGRLDHYRHQWNTPEFAATLQREAKWVRDSHDAVVAGVPVYLRLLEHPDPRVRGMAPYTLSVCHERYAEIEPALRRRLAQETHPEVRASLVYARCDLWEQPASSGSPSDAAADDRVGLLAELMRAEEETPLVRMVAAIALVRLGGARFSAEAVSIFRKAENASLDPVIDLPWLDGNSLVSEMSEALVSQPDLRLQWLLEMLEHPHAGTRGDAVWALETVCGEQRSAPRRVVPRLAALLADPDAEVRNQAARMVPTLGSARQEAIRPLQELLNHPSAEVRAAAGSCLDEIRRKQNEPTPAERYLRLSYAARPLPMLLSLLSAKLRHRDMGNLQGAMDAMVALERRGPRARGAAPLLREALDHEEHWIRVHAARALWHIEHDAGGTLPILLREFRPWPAGLLVLDCLAAMGPAAAPALPTLRRLIEAKERATPDIDLDEALCAAASHALAQIEG